MKVKQIIIFISFMFLSSNIFAVRLHYESVYQAYINSVLFLGDVEVTLPDGTRADIVNTTHAVEVDFTDKWAEAVGQSLYYSFRLQKIAGIVLILDDPSNATQNYNIKKVAVLCYKYNIDLWVVYPVSQDPNSNIFNYYKVNTEITERRY